MQQFFHNSGGGTVFLYCSTKTADFSGRVKIFSQGVRRRRLWELLGKSSHALKNFGGRCENFFRKKVFTLSKNFKQGAAKRISWGEVAGFYAGNGKRLHLPAGRCSPTRAVFRQFRARESSLRDLGIAPRGVKKGCFPSKAGVFERWRAVDTETALPPTPASRRKRAGEFRIAGEGLLYSNL